MSKTLPIAGTETHCSCDTCKSMCNRPCWPTPMEAKELIKLGYGSRLMNDYWSGSINGGLDGDYYDIHLLCGANTGLEGERAGYSPRGAPCTFQDKETKLCGIHNSGCKPTEGRLADCKDKTPKNLHKKVAELWENEAAQRLVDRWYKHKDDEDTEWVLGIILNDEPEFKASKTVTNEVPIVAYCADDVVTVKRSDDTWTPGIILRREGPWWVVRVVKDNTIPEDFRGHYGYKYVLDMDAPHYIRKA